MNDLIVKYLMFLEVDKKREKWSKNGNILHRLMLLLLLQKAIRNRASLRSVFYAFNYGYNFFETRFYSLANYLISGL